MTGIQGFKVSIDSDGDTEANYTVMFLQQNEGKIRPHLENVGYFISQNSTANIPVSVLFENLSPQQTQCF